MLWQLQEAKSKFSEVLRMALSKGPQRITLRGEEVAILLSKVEYDALRGKKKNFLDFMHSSPLKGLDLNLNRDKSPVRKVEL